MPSRWNARMMATSFRFLRGNPGVADRQISRKIGKVKNLGRDGRLERAQPTSSLARL